jgi:hypothetical protein
MEGSLLFLVVGAPFKVLFHDALVWGEGCAAGATATTVPVFDAIQGEDGDTRDEHVEDVDGGDMEAKHGVENRVLGFGVGALVEAHKGGAQCDGEEQGEDGQVFLLLEDRQHFILQWGRRSKWRFSLQLGFEAHKYKPECGRIDAHIACAPRDAQV